MMTLFSEFQFIQDSLTTNNVNSSQTETIVLQLTHDFFDKDYLFLVDNYYSYVALAKYLAKNLHLWYLKQ